MSIKKTLLFTTIIGVLANSNVFADTRAGTLTVTGTVASCINLTVESAGGRRASSGLVLRARMLPAGPA
jgi:hypothetical protein